MEANETNEMIMKMFTFLSWLTALISISIAWVTSGIFTSLFSELVRWRNKAPDMVSLDDDFSFRWEFASLFANWFIRKLKLFFPLHCLWSRIRKASFVINVTSRQLIKTIKRVAETCAPPNKPHLIKHFVDRRGSVSGAANFTLSWGKPDRAIVKNALLLFLGVALTKKMIHLLTKMSFLFAECFDRRIRLRFVNRCKWLIKHVTYLSWKYF